MSDKQTYTLQVNGRPRQVTAAPQSLLMDVLRDDLRLTGVKDGCATGHCGSCMVIKDGEAVRSCLVLMKRAEGADITTIEGVAGPGGGLHPIQQGFILKDAPQCGFCMSGQMMSAYSLLQAQPKPDFEQIRMGLSGNICRCGNYNHLWDAVAWAAEHSA